VGKPLQNVCGRKSTKNEGPEQSKNQGLATVKIRETSAMRFFCELVNAEVSSRQGCSILRAGQTKYGLSSIWQIFFYQKMLPKRKAFFGNQNVS
jgi:hypothetical protein